MGGGAGYWKARAGMRRLNSYSAGICFKQEKDVSASRPWMMSPAATCKTAVYANYATLLSAPCSLLIVNCQGIGVYFRASAFTFQSQETKKD
jgi:hypothetical protein